MARDPSEGFPWAGLGLQGVVGAEHGFIWEHEWLGLDPAPSPGQGL